MRHYVYRLDDPITGEFYIGSRSCKCKIEDDTYMGSYKTWQPENKSRLIKTILNSNFKNRENTIEFERLIIKENIGNELNRNYNIPGNKFHMVGTIGYWKDKSLSEKTKGKIRNALIGYTHSKSARENMSGRIPWNFEKKLSKLTCEKMSISKTGIKTGPISDDKKLKISIALIGRKLTNKHKKNISKGGTGRYIGPMSDDHKKKIGESNRGKIQTKIKCPYCEKEGGIPSMKRWHFNNCNDK